MNLLFNKTFSDLDISTNTYFDDNNISKTPGSIAKLLLNLINTNIADLYSALTVNHVLSFLSTAQDSAVDEIGYMMNCTRIVDEIDDDYKYRISKWILTTATANETAIRLAALGITDVQDIVMRKFSYGPGTYTIVILTNNVSANSTVITNVTTVVEAVNGYGINYEIVNPDMKYVSLKIKLLNQDTSSDGSNLDMSYLTMDALKIYLLSRPIGGSIIIDDITKIIKNINSGIISYICTEIRINGKIAMFINQDCRWNERFILSLDADAIMVE